MHARAEIKYELYAKLIDIEIRCALDIAQTLVLPAVLEHTTALANAVGAVADAGVDASAIKTELATLSASFKAIQSGIANLKAALEQSEGKADLHQKTAFLAGPVLDSLSALREAVDRSETLVPDDLWPLSKYQELLYVLG